MSCSIMCDGVDATTRYRKVGVGEEPWSPLPDMWLDRANMILGRLWFKMSDQFAY